MSLSPEREEKIEHPSLFTSRDPSKPAPHAHELMKIGPGGVSQPKFLRDNLEVKDIPGTTSSRLYKWPTRDLHSVNDIAGAQP